MVPAKPSVRRVGRRAFLTLAVGAMFLAPVQYVHGQESPASVSCVPPSVLATPGQSLRVDRGPTECGRVALTFDAGSDRGYAELILDILRENKIHAGFGMTGTWATANPDLVRRIGDEGHEFINHTWDHPSFTGASSRTTAIGSAERLSQLEWTDDLIRELSGKTSRPYFRPPFGDLNEGVLKDVADAGYDYTIMWTVDSFGWNRLPAAGIVERCLSLAEPGAIYIFHVGSDSEDALALGPILEGLRARGLGFATIGELLGLNKPDTAP
jgi:peptidoglycan/xylan/chitin deacetylase (PgdA/CDA1 family)